MEENAPKRKHWLLMSSAVVNGNQVTKIISWDFATEEEIVTFYKKVLPPGVHFIAPLENVITIENTIQTVDNKAIILKPN
jgi:hypothetical protein